MGRAPRQEQTEGPSAAVRTDLGSYRLGKLDIWEVATQEDTLGKLPIGKNPLEKYLGGGWGVLRGGNQGVEWSYSGLIGVEMVIKE